MWRFLFLAALFWASAAQPAGLNKLSSIQGSIPFYWNFINSQSLPPDWKLARAACTGSVVACATNAQYNDASGAPYITYLVNHPVFSPRGVGIFENRTNYLFPSDTPTTTTTGTVPIGYYVFMCNGTGSVLTAAGTGVGTGLGTLNCSSSYQTVQVTTAGTFIFTPTGTVNWWDFQGPCLYANASCGPTPHIVTTSGTSSRVGDISTLASPQGQMINRGASSIVMEYYSTSSGLTNQIVILGSSTNGFQLSPIDSNNGNKCSSNVANVASLATSGSNQALFTLNRVAATNSAGRYILSCNGQASTNSASSSSTVTGNAETLGTTGGTYYCNCWVSQMKIFPLPLSSSQLILYSSAGSAF